MREGTTFRLSCMSMGGNPLATLKWYKKGSNKEVTSYPWKANYLTRAHMKDIELHSQLKSENSASGNVASAKLEMLAKREDNGKELRCEATNPALEATLKDTAIVRVECKSTTAPAKQNKCVSVSVSLRFVTKEYSP